jgi:hypothetical protein
MKLQEFKLRLSSGINGLIDDYFGSMSTIDKMINSTLKIIVKQNTHKFDSLFELFMDENGCIDPNIIIEEYSNAMGDNGLILDLRDFISNGMVKNILPNKALVIKKDDIKKIFKENNNLN